MCRLLFGVETEFAFTALDRSGSALDRSAYVPRLLKFVQRRLPHLHGHGPGDVYLGNGSRLYTDCGRHPEWSTPECSTPEEVVKYVRAGERVLAQAARDLQDSDSTVARAWLFKCNVDYFNTGSTWGSHESYLHRQKRQTQLTGQLIPHLVSRVIFSGAGGLNPKSPGIEFVLSPRVAHLEKEVSMGSTGERGIYHTKDEALSGTGYHRLHVISGESLCSHVADYLRVGTTALIVKLVDAGLHPGEGVRLVTPLDAMRDYVADAECVSRAAVIGGKTLSAVDIQRHYLGQVERHADAPFMPRWAGEVCRRWREVLDALETDAASMTTLDWPIKRAVFTERARRRGFAWQSLPTWNRVLRWFRDRLGERGHPAKIDVRLASAVLRYGVSLTDEAKYLSGTLSAVGMTLDQGLEQFLALRRELCEIDTRFGQLGADGVFAAMDRAGVLNHRIVDDTEIEGAMETAPRSGRGRLRGERIRQLAPHRKRYECHWQRIVDHERNQLLDFSDPFAETANWSQWR